MSEGTTTTVEYATDSAGRPFGAWVTIPEREGAVWVWLVTNQRGDVLELLASDGTAISHRAYSAYGETMSGASRAAGGLTGTQASAIDSAITLRYAGYTHDGESGLYYCSQRYYDPVSCQWITKDPARADGEESAYQYCGGDPVGSVDPTGLKRIQLNGYEVVKQGGNPTCFYVALISVIKWMANKETSVGRLKKLGFESRTKSAKNVKLLKKHFKLKSRKRTKLPKWESIQKEIRARRPLIVAAYALDGQGGQRYDENGKKIGAHALTIIGTNTAHGRKRLFTMNWDKKASIDDWNFRNNKKGARWNEGNRLRSEPGVWWKFKRQ